MTKLTKPQPNKDAVIEFSFDLTRHIRASALSNDGNDMIANLFKTFGTHSQHGKSHHLIVHKQYDFNEVLNYLKQELE